MLYTLFCNNGLGDKLLDVIGIITYTKLIDCECKIIFNDFIKYYNFGSENFYDVKHFIIDNINIINNYQETEKDEILLVSSKFNINSLTYNNNILENKPTDYKIPLIIYKNEKQIEYFYHCITYSPLNIYNKLNNKYALIDITDLYIKQAKNIKPSNYIESLIPNNLNNCYGIHLRKSDKIKTENEYKLKKKYNMHLWSNNITEYNYIINKTKEYILKIISNDKNAKFFICSEDIQYKEEFKNWIILNKGNIIDINHIEEELIPIYELFCLSRCKEIIQAIKYSSFSVTAALIGNCKKLTNFFNDDDNDNFLNIFKPVININNLQNIDYIKINELIEKYKL